MKKILFFSVLLSFLASCGPDPEKTMTVTGTVKGLKKGTLFLQKVADSVLVTLDSLEVKGDGSFAFKTQVESPEIFYLYLNKVDHNDFNDRIRFFGEPGTVTINTSWNTFDSNAKIDGSMSHAKFEEYQKVMSRFNTRDLEIANRAIMAGNTLDSLQIDSILMLSDRNLKRGYVYAINFALNNNDSYVAPYIALLEIPDANIKFLDSIYNSITPEVADSKYGRELKNYLDELKQQ